MENSQVRGTVHFGAQQQCMTRSSTIGGTSSGVWNMVFVGTEGAPANHCGQDMNGSLPFVVVDEAPALAERPFITVDASGSWTLNVPQVHFNTFGASMYQADHEQLFMVEITISICKPDSMTVECDPRRGKHMGTSTEKWRKAPAVWPMTRSQMGDSICQKRRPGKSPSGQRWLRATRGFNSTETSTA